MQAVAGSMQSLEGANGVLANEKMRQSRNAERDAAVNSILAAIRANRKIVPDKDKDESTGIAEIELGTASPTLLNFAMGNRGFPQETEQQTLIKQALGLKKNPFGIPQEYTEPASLLMT